MLEKENKEAEELPEGYQMFPTEQNEWEEKWSIRVDKDWNMMVWPEDSCKENPKNLTWLDNYVKNYWKLTHMIWKDYAAAIGMGWEEKPEDNIYAELNAHIKEIRAINDNVRTKSLARSLDIILKLIKNINNKWTS